MIVTEKWTNIYTHKVLEENKAVLHRKRQVRINVNLNYRINVNLNYRFSCKGQIYIDTKMGI